MDYVWNIGRAASERLKNMTAQANRAAELFQEEYSGIPFYTDAYGQIDNVEKDQIDQIKQNLAINNNNESNTPNESDRLNEETIL